MAVTKILDPQLTGSNPQDVLNALGNGVYKGTATLTSGVSPALSCPISSSAVIVCSLKTAGSSMTSTVNYGALSGDRNTTAGTFVVSALTNAGAVDTSNTSTVVDVIVIV